MASPKIIFLFLALSATVFGEEACDQDYLDDGHSSCCTITHGTIPDNHDATYSCEDMIVESSVDWTVGSSYTLTCEHGDKTSTRNDCVWETPKGTCTYNFATDVSSCPDDNIAFIDTDEDPYRSCNINVANAEESYSQNWTCLFTGTVLKYKDSIIVNVKDDLEVVPAGKVAAIAAPMTLIIATIMGLVML